MQGFESIEMEAFRDNLATQAQAFTILREMALLEAKPCEPIYTKTRLFSCEGHDLCKPRSTPRPTTGWLVGGRRSPTTRARFGGRVHAPGDSGFSGPFELASLLGARYSRAPLFSCFLRLAFSLCHANIRCDTVLAQLRGSSSGMRRVQVEIRSCEVSQKIGTIHWVHVCFQSRFFAEVLIILGFSPCLPSL